MSNGNRTLSFVMQQTKIVIRCRTLLLMLAPALILVIIFSYIPMYGVVVAFKQFNYADGIMGSPWAGFKNFEFFFKSGQWWPVTRNTMLYSAVFLVVNTFLQLLFALVLSELTSMWFKKTSQTLMLLPYFISWVVVGAMSYNLFNYERGAVNSLLIGLGFDRVDIYGLPHIWPFLLVIFSAWKGVGYNTVVYLAAITGLDQQIMEAAEIDGANIFQRIRHVTLPSIAPTIIILFLLHIGNLFRGDFGMFYNLVGLNNGRLFATTDIIDMYVFRSLFTSGGMERGAAAGLYQSLLCFITIMTANFLVRKYDKDYALF
ncbi:MAG: ABC transporter permease [Christensenellales bacterium]|jgi:putative aldouronate transport system permease protein